MENRAIPDVVIAFRTHLSVDVDEFALGLKDVIGLASAFSRTLVAGAKRTAIGKSRYKVTTGSQSKCHSP